MKHSSLPGVAWDLFDRDGGGGFQICGIDTGSSSEAPVAALPIGCEITVEAESASPDALGATERDLEVITDSLSGRIVATGRTRTKLTTLAYLPSDRDAERYTKIALPAGASVSVAPAIDPDWTLFAAARPSGMEEQSLLDYRVRSELHAAGDNGGVRTIDHVVTGLGAGQFEGFSSAVASIGVEVAQVDGERVEITQRADPKDVTETSWTVRLIAERFGGVYEGWRCGVLRDVSAGTTSTRSRRRWLRRS